MLLFDAQQSSFYLDGVRIGSGTSLGEVTASFGDTVTVANGAVGWMFVSRDCVPVSASITLKDEVVHSGAFWASWIRTDGWDAYEAGERKRRVEHEKMMLDLFGKARFEGASIEVGLVRDPRSGFEQIVISIK